MAFGSPTVKINAYKYGTQFPLTAHEGCSNWVTLDFTVPTTTILDAVNSQLGLLKNIPSDIFPTEIHLVATDMDTDGSPTLDINLTAVRSDESEVIILEAPITTAAVETSFSVDNTAADFTTGDSISELKTALGGLNYDLVLDVQTAAATSAEGTCNFRIKFMRDVRDPGTIHNASIADGA